MILDILPSEIKSIILNRLDDISLIVWDSASDNDPIETIKSRMKKDHILEIVKYSVEYIDYFTKNKLATRYDMCLGAAHTGNLLYLKHVFPGNQINIKTYDVGIQDDGPLDKTNVFITKLYKEAARGNSVNVLRWLHERVPRKNNVGIIATAAEAGSTDALWVLRQLGYEWDERAVSLAGKNNHADLVRDLIMKGCPALDSWAGIVSPALACLARDGTDESLSVLKELKSNFDIYECARKLAFSGQIKPLEWGLNLFGTIDRFVYYDVFKYDYDHIFDWLEQHKYHINDRYGYEVTVCSLAISAGKYQKLPNLLKLGYTLDPVCMVRAVGDKNIECIQFLFDNDCPIDDTSYLEAAYIGSVKILDMLYTKTNNINHHTRNIFYHEILSQYLEHYIDRYTIDEFPEFLIEFSSSIGSLDNLLEVLDWAIEHDIELTNLVYEEIMGMIELDLSNVQLSPILDWLERNRPR